MIRITLQTKILLTFLFIFISSCSEETILYNEIEKEGTVQSIIIPERNNKIFQTFPIHSSNSKLFFGNEKGSENLFSLIQMTLFSGNIPPTNLVDLLADSI